MGPTIKHAEAGKIELIDDTLGSARYQEILNEIVLLFVCKLGLGRGRIFQQGNYPKHHSKSTKDNLAGVPEMRNFYSYESDLLHPFQDPTESLHRSSS